MTYTKIFETPSSVVTPHYTSEILRDKFTELTNSGDVTQINETLSNGNKKSTQVWRDEATYNTFKSWLNSSGELARQTAYYEANKDITIIKDGQYFPS